MIAFVVIYMTISLSVYWAMFVWLSKPKSCHPEMREVRPNDRLLVVKFDDSSRASGSEQHLDLGFSEFLANRGPSDGNNDHP
jgi:hypothetical protein